MRFGGTNSPALTSEIFRRMPLTFSTMRPRNMVTMWNMHFDRISAAPFLPFDPTQPAHYVYSGAGNPKSTFNPVTSAPDAKQTTPLPANSEYGSDWRSTLGQNLRVNLNRTLTRYPAPSGPDQLISNTSLVVYNEAVLDRQNLARDIYNALIRVTGAQDPNALGVVMVNTSPEYKASRWLAQLAVNIVDYIDEDDYMTPFNWDTKVSPADGWVFGTEQPRMVLNEIYAQHELESQFTPLDGSGPTGPSGQPLPVEQHRINLWAELLNPLKKTPLGYPLNGGYAQLDIAGRPIYKIQIHPSSLALTTALRDSANSRGSAPTTPLTTQQNWGVLNPVTHRVDLEPSYQVNGVVNGPPTLFSANIKPPNAMAANSGASNMGTTVTITTATALTNLQVGHAVTISGVTKMDGTPAMGYNGTFNVTAIAGKQFKYTAAVPATQLGLAGNGTAIWVKDADKGFYVVGPEGARYNTPLREPKLPATWVSPQMAIPYVTQAIAAAPTGAKHAGTTVTITTKKAHGFKVNERVIIGNVGGVGVSGYNGTFTITTVPALPKDAAGQPTSFTYTSTVLGGPSGGGTAIASIPNATLLLRRLANPHMPLNNTPGPLYNPYVTVDYVDGIPVNLNTGAASTFKSFGRNQPYAANRSQILAQIGANPAQPGNTFFQHNSNASLPFMWLTHLDRPLVNQLELLYVSGYRPHELTQQFGTGPSISTGLSVPSSGGAPGPGLVTNTGGVTGGLVTGGDLITPLGSYQHIAPWDKQDALVYRALDLLATPNHMQGTFAGGRFPGQINLNTITELEIFQALCDSQDSQTNPLFTTADVIRIFGKVRNAQKLPAPEGTPFQPFAAGDITKTWLRPGGVFDLNLGFADAHPYGQKALLQKIFNNITTTSNVFGVWWTAGYFEVVDESVRPARLGKEIGRDENRHIRHRFFAVVDRSGMELFKTTSQLSSVTGPTIAYWDPSIKYVLNTNVLYNDVGGNVVRFRCTKANAGIPPIGALNSTANWVRDSVTVGAAWSSGVAYNVGSNVVYGGLHYRCKQENTGIVPTNTTYWQRVTLRMNFASLPVGAAANGVPITIQPGMMLEIGGNEVVSVLTATGNSFTANFTKSHPLNTAIVCRGNPGVPALRGTQQATTYNPRHDSSVVLHMSVIQ
jgi:hypothetical protein